MAFVGSAIWRGSKRRFSNRSSASGDWRWRERRRVSMRAGTFKAKLAITTIRNRSATSIRSARIPQDADLLESTLAKLSQMVGRRLREHELHARTIQIKLRYSDFTTLTRAHTLDAATQIDLELIEQSRLLFRKNWNGSPVRLLGVQTSSLEHTEGQMNLLEGEKTRKWRSALTAVDKLRDRFGEKSVSVASGMKGMYEERVHENPVGLPGKKPNAGETDEKKEGR